MITDFTWGLILGIIIGFFVGELLEMWAMKKARIIDNNKEVK